MIFGHSSRFQCIRLCFPNLWSSILWSTPMFLHRSIGECSSLKFSDLAHSLVQRAAMSSTLPDYFVKRLSWHFKRHVDWKSQKTRSPTISLIDRFKNLLFWHVHRKHLTHAYRGYLAKRVKSCHRSSVNRKSHFSIQPEVLQTREVNYRIIQKTGTPLPIPAWRGYRPEL